MCAMVPFAMVLYRSDRFVWCSFLFFRAPKTVWESLDCVMIKGIFNKNSARYKVPKMLKRWDARAYMPVQHSKIFQKVWEKWEKSVINRILHTEVIGLLVKFDSREIGGLSLCSIFPLSSFGQCNVYRGSSFVCAHSICSPLPPLDTRHFAPRIRPSHVHWVDCRISVFEPFQFNNKEQTLLIWCICSYLSFRSSASVAFAVRITFFVPCASASLALFPCACVRQTTL